MTKKFALDIFSLLGSINSGDYSQWGKLTTEQQKAFAPVVVIRWMSGTSDEQQIIAINTFANQMIYPLAKHPELLMKLLTACASRKQKRYAWISTKSKIKNALSVEVVSQYFEMSKREVLLMNPFPQPDEILQMAEHMGWQKDEINKLKKELVRE